ncbi:5'-nucleotidase, partial [Streptomyces sp. SID13726]|nr:5'-nucleotidase [Streptomyces sp. SID13726]
DPLVEVIVMSRNSPETGLRVMRSIRHHDLDITRAVFRQGRSPHEFIRPLHVDLFLSADERSVRDAVDLGLGALDRAGRRVGHAGAVDDVELDQDLGAGQGRGAQDAVVAVLGEEGRDEGVASRAVGEQLDRREQLGKLADRLGGGGARVADRDDLLAPLTSLAGGRAVPTT